MIILTRSMIDINVVLIADRIEKKENMDSYDLEKIYITRMATNQKSF